MWRHSLLPCLVISAMAQSTRSSADIPPQFEEDQITSPLHVQAGMFYYRLTLDQTTLTGEGPEIGLLKPVSSSWALSGSLSQAYSYNKSLVTMYTGFDVGAWYAAAGHFAQETHRWKQNGITIVDYAEKSSGIFRVGMAMQQYFLNSSKGAIPFSGVVLKCMYDYDLDLPFRLGTGVDWARLANNSDKITVTRLMFTLEKNLGP